MYAHIQCKLPDCTDISLFGAEWMMRTVRDACLACIHAEYRGICRGGCSGWRPSFYCRGHCGCSYSTRSLTSITIFTRSLESSAAHATRAWLTARAMLQLPTTTRSFRATRKRWGWTSAEEPSPPSCWRVTEMPPRQRTSNLVLKLVQQLLCRCCEASGGRGRTTSCRWRLSAQIAPCTVPLSTIASDVLSYGPAPVDRHTFEHLPPASRGRRRTVSERRHTVVAVCGHADAKAAPYRNENVDEVTTRRSACRAAARCR